MRFALRSRWASVVAVLATLAGTAYLTAHGVNSLIVARLAASLSVIGIGSGPAAQLERDVPVEPGSIVDDELIGAAAEPLAEQPETIADAKRSSGAARPRSRAERARAARGGAEDEASDGIRALGGGRYSVQRAVVDRVLRSPAEMLRSERAVARQENGRYVGIALSGIGQDSLLRKLGLQNGDVLRSINGYSLADADSALDAYAKLRTASDLSLTFVRGGSAHTVACHIGP